MHEQLVVCQHLLGRTQLKMSCSWNGPTHQSDAACISTLVLAALPAIRRLPGRTELENELWLKHRETEATSQLSAILTASVLATLWVTRRCLPFQQSACGLAGCCVRQLCSGMRACCQPELAV